MANLEGYLTRLFPESVARFLQCRIAEGMGLVLFVAAMGIIVALLSYTPTDTSFNVASHHPAYNLLGSIGAYIADFLLQGLGIAAGVPSSLIAIWGLQLIAKKPIRWSVRYLALMLISTLFIAVALSAAIVPQSWPLRVHLGGIIGNMLFDRLVLLSAFMGLSEGDKGFIVITLTTSLLGVVFYTFALGFSRQQWRAVSVWLLRSSINIVRLFAIGCRAIWRGIIFLQTCKRKGLDFDRQQTGQSIRKRKRKKNHLNGQKNKLKEAIHPIDNKDFVLPPLELLQPPSEHHRQRNVNKEVLQTNVKSLESVLQDFGVHGEITAVRPGPVVTLYELEPAPGTKTSRVVGLSNDIARSMSAISVRIAVIPGRSVIGIELPNHYREIVLLREMIGSREFKKSASKMGLALALGKDISGEPITVDLSRMPHLLIAGTTGSGKSVAINTMILSILYRYKPNQCRFIMIDPKMLELSVYDDIPHLLAPVVTEPSKAIFALKWTVREMEDRYRAMANLGVRNIDNYNQRILDATMRGETLTRRVQTGFDANTGKPIFEEQPLDMTPLPFIIVVVDEMADLMMVAGKDIEAAIQRLAQMARAAGIHVILATQRPSVDVITGTIKANFPTRVSFQVTSKIDSRTILGEQGAEQLLGRGDMLYMAGGGRISRIHGPFVSDEEVEEVVTFLKQQGKPVYVEAVTEERGDNNFDIIGMGKSNNGSGDPFYNEAVAIVAREHKVSTSFIQRHLQIGYNRAARIVERMEQEGIISKANRSGKREILIGDQSDFAPS